MASDDREKREKQEKKQEKKREKRLAKIEKRLDKLGRRQSRMLDRLECVEEHVAVETKPEAPSCEQVVAFLDAFRAGEALGESSLGAWIAVSTTACVKGGLRTVQCREGMHARLLEQRIKELGGSSEAQVPEAIYEATMQSASSRSKSDAEKLAEFMARFPDVDAALQPIVEMADRLDHDPETQSLLRTIMQDERSTLEFLGEACAQLNA